MSEILLNILILLGVCVILIPGVRYFYRNKQHKKLMIRKNQLDQKVDEWRVKDFAKAQEYSIERSKVLDKIFQYQNEMAQSNYYLAAGAFIFALIELYKLISTLILNK